MTEKKKPISVKSRKAKARKLQNWIAEKLASITGLTYGQPGDHDKDYRGREMGQKGVDVLMSKQAKELTPFSIEAKNAETWHIQKDLEQAKRNKQVGTEWMLVYKKNNISPVIVIDAEYFFSLYSTILNKDSLDDT